MAVYAIVQSGTLVSSGVTLERSDRPFSVLVPSAAGTTLQVEFAALTPSLATSADYFRLHDGVSGFPFTAYSGTAAGITAPMLGPTPFLRLRLGAATVAPRSFEIISVLRS